MENHDDRIDRALAAIRNASPPDGMEARITRRLAAASPASRWNLLRAWLPAGPWLRGACTGVLVATAACALIFYAMRQASQPRQQHAAVLEQPHAATPVALNTAAPCAGRTSRANSPAEPRADTDVRVPHSSRGLLRDEWEERSSPRSPHLIPASFAPSQPAPPAPLTDQERALIRLVQTATPAQFAALSPAAEQKSNADRQAAFEKFFAPSPDLVAVEKAEEDAAGTQNSPSPQLKKLQN